MTNYSQQFLRAFRTAGDRGVANYDLAKIALQYNFEIHVLRKAGHNIKKRRVYRDGKASSTWVYYLVEDEVKQDTNIEQPKAISWLEDGDM